MPKNKKSLHAVGKNDARPEFLAADAAENSGKRKKVLAITIFQREFKRNSKLYSNQPMDNMGLINAAKEAFNNLSPLEQQRYEAMASQENREKVEKEGHNWQKDQFGRAKLSLMKQSELLKKWQNVDSLEHMQLLLAGSAKEIARRSFLIVRASFYLGEPGHKIPGVDLIVPAEITLIRFSLLSGCEEKITLLPKAANVPDCFNSTGVESQEIHGLVMIDKDGDDGNSLKLSPMEVVQRIRQFINPAYTPDDRPPPLFALGKSYYDVIPMGLKHIYDAAGVQCPFILPKANYGFCYQLEEFTELMHKRGKQLQGQSVSLELEGMTYITYREAPTNIRINQCCEVHSIMDRPEPCTQTAACCHLWWLLYSCLGFYGVAPTERHFPAALLKVWDFDRLSSGSSEPSPSPTPPMTSPQRPMGGRGRGVTLGENSLPRRPGGPGRGRGRGLRGPLPTNLE